ncbi:MAG TPA: Flp pilus assembly protein CpaB [Acidimicrobiia bacterium]
MGNRRALIAAAAIVLAAAAGILVYFYVSAADKRAEDKVSLVDAYVATGDIPKGTTGDRALAEGLIDVEQVLRGSVPPSAVTDSSLLGGKVAASTISARQFITDASFVSPAEGGGGSLAASIGDGSRVAVTISVDAERGVANQIAPGDRVDILVVNEGAADYILRDVKVLAVGQETAKSAAGGDGQPSETAAKSGLITFELSPDDAAQVVAANRSGTLYLTLKPITGGTAGDTSVAASGG